MTTPFHALSGLALLSSKEHPKRNLWILLGAVFADIFVIIFGIVLTLGGYSQSQIWDEMYFQDNFQVIFNTSHSFVLYGGLIVVSYLWKKESLRYFSFAAIFHIFLDFWVHATDAYSHFYPVSDWRFFSPISYYDSDYYGQWVGLLELIVFILFVPVVYKRLDTKRGKRYLLILSILWIIASLVINIISFGFLPSL